MSAVDPVIFLCNDAQLPDGGSAAASRIQILNYESRCGRPANLRIGLPDFVRGVYHLPDRVLDLLELAAYVYCADRMTSRGQVKALEYHAWARSLHFVARVRDHEFWRQKEVSDGLSGALEFMTGDRRYCFTFLPGHTTPPTGLFDAEEFRLSDAGKPSVLLFSGGLDSLAGAIQCLEDSDANVCLVSHQSQAGTKRTQNQLARALRDRYPNRVSHYKFSCHLAGQRAVEETQRTRAFLYMSIAYAIAQAYGCDEFLVHENGITSINFPRREDLANARASRTTHPQTIGRLQGVFSLVGQRKMCIGMPFLWKTKTDVVDGIRKGPQPELLPSSVSCSKTFQNLGQASHCGGCSQCVDRRFAAYGSGSDDLDESGLYAQDIIAGNIADGAVKTTAVDYVRQARKFATWNIDHFAHEMVSELAELVDHVPDCRNETETTEKVWQLCRRHGHQVEKGMDRMRELHDNLYEELPRNSLLQLISGREYLKKPVDRLVASLRDIALSIPEMFAVDRPLNENDLNQKISALFDSHKLELMREHPVVSFAGGHTVADHGRDDLDLVVETKYVRGGTSPSKASDGMAADITKYPQEAHILFLVYDPGRAIRNDQRFIDDLESRGRCTVQLLR